MLNFGSNISYDTKYDLPHPDGPTILIRKELLSNKSLILFIYNIKYNIFI